MKCYPLTASLPAIIRSEMQRLNVGKQTYLHCRERKYVHARWRIWHFAHKEKGMSLSEIGRRYNKDHTSILYGMRKYEQILNEGR